MYTFSQLTKVKITSIIDNKKLNTDFFIVCNDMCKPKIRDACASF